MRKPVSKDTIEAMNAAAKALLDYMLDNDPGNPRPIDACNMILPATWELVETSETNSLYRTTEGAYINLNTTWWDAAFNGNVN